MKFPARNEWHAYLRFIAGFCALFFPVYFGAGYLTEGSGRAIAMYLPAETHIPLVPSMIIAYASLYPVFALPLLHMSATEMAVLSRQSTFSLLIAGACFLLIPGEMGFPPRNVDGWQTPLFDIIDAIDTKHNLVPSLHVAFAALIILAVIPRAPRLLAPLYALWLVWLTSSTLLVHQHHLIDVLAGFTVATLARTLFPYTTKIIPTEPGAA